MATLAINESVHIQRALRLVLQAVGLNSAVQVTAHTGANAFVTLANGQQFQELQTVVRAITDSKPGLYGATAAQSGAVADAVQWVQNVDGSKALSEAGTRLSQSAFIAGSSLTVADPLVFFALNDSLKAAAATLWSKHPSVARWVDQLQHESSLSLTDGTIALPSRPALDVGVGKAKGKKEEKGVAASPAAAGVATKGPAPAADAAPAGAKTDSEDPIAYCNFLVGEIVDCWKHPESDKLWCEKIDVGEAAPREIASGLQQVFTLEQMKGQRVVVIANLQARKLAGFPSNGMVLCATGPDGTIEFVEPPAGAKNGERVLFEGHVAPAAEPNRVAKKKLWEAVSPDLKVDEHKRATWNGVPFMTAAGPCTVKSVPAGSLIK